MAMPSFEDLMLPLLKLLSDQRERSTEDLVRSLKLEMHLSDEEVGKKTAVRAKPIFENRVSWAKTYLKQAGLLFSERRGRARLSSTGAELLAESPDRINIALLEKYPAFQEFRGRHMKKMKMRRKK